MAQYRQDETDISLSMLLEVVDALKGYGADAVSYTHLTLPTNREV